MIPSAAFNAQNDKGKVAEFRVASAFMSHGWWVRMSQVGSRWDLVVGKDDIYENVEIKNEVEYEGSGNICVELGQGNPRKASGIQTSESTFYVHYFGDRSLVLRTQSFRLYLDAIRRTEQVKPFGDNNNIGFIIARIRLACQPWAKEVNSDDIPKAISSMRNLNVA